MDLLSAGVAIALLDPLVNLAGWAFIFWRCPFEVGPRRCSRKLCGAMLTMRYLCEPRARRGTAEAIWEDALTAFGNESSIDFADPIQRFYRSELEGKAAMRPPPAR